jgi:hypothetical protein
MFSVTLHLQRRNLSRCVAPAKVLRSSLNPEKGTQWHPLFADFTDLANIVVTTEAREAGPTQKEASKRGGGVVGAD